MSGENDAYNIYLEIHAGAGGTESQDWAQMLYRMYSRWVEKQDFKLDVIDYQQEKKQELRTLQLKLRETMHTVY